MKILAVSDIHQLKFNHHGVERSENIYTLFKIINIERPDVVFICGDLENVTKQDMDDLKELSIVLNFKVFIIFGNHDSPSIIEHSGMLVDGLVKYNNLTIGGIGGVVAKGIHDGVLRLNYDEFLIKSNKIKNDLIKDGKNLDILLTHELPKTHNEVNNDFYDVRSSSVFGDILYQLEPKLAISGHLHGDGTFIFDYEYGTLINLGAFNEGHYVIINLDDNSYEIESIKPIDI